MIVDAHTHISDTVYGNFNIYQAQMEQAGIDKAVLFPGGMIDVRKMNDYITGKKKGSEYIPNELILTLIKKDPKKYFGFICINPLIGEKCLQDFKQGITEGFKGLKLAPIVHNFSLSASVVNELTGLCGQFNVPLYTHVVFNPGASTEKIELLAKNYPGTNIIIGHMGFGPIDNFAIELARKYSNVFLETSNSSFLAVKTALEIAGAEKIIFGSEFPLSHACVELKKIECAVNNTGSFEKIVSKNILNLLGGK